MWPTQQIKLERVIGQPAAVALPESIAFASEPGRLLPSTADLLTFVNSLDAVTRYARYPSLATFARDIGIAQDSLIASYELERVFHDLILVEKDPIVRRRLNEEVYTKTFELYGTTFSVDIDTQSNPKDVLVELLTPELEGKSILDVGCGAGNFLLSCSRKISHGRLLGIDTFARDVKVTDRNLAFIRCDVVDFDLDTQFDVVMSDNVFEHIAPDDVEAHLGSIRKALRPDGIAIVLTPHRAFGPWDVTRIVDESYTGWLPARGTHLNEVTYLELTDVLIRSGFGNLRSIPPKVRLGLRKSPRTLPTALFCRAERRPRLMRALQAMDKRYRLTAFEICIIATRI